jgi:SnoaL-like domain
MRTRRNDQGTGGHICGWTRRCSAVLALYEAMRDSRLADVLALVDLDVVCEPLVRPGLAAYYGYDGMAGLVRDMHAVHGRYRVEIAEITEQEGPRVTVRAVIVPEPGHGQPMSVTSVYAFRSSLIASIESFLATLGCHARGDAGPAPGLAGSRRACHLAAAITPARPLIPLPPS